MTAAAAARPRQPKPRPLAAALAAALALLLAAGCASTPKLEDQGPVFTPANVRGPAAWPADYRRVAVLPAHDATGRLTDEFTLSHDELWRRALDRTQRAEFVSLARPALQAWFGRATLGSADPLPHGMLGRLGRETGAQAVIFLDLTHSKPFPPLALSFRARLVDLRSGETVWASDELFDAGDITVVRAARRHARANSSGPGDAAYGVLQSPSRFADYAFSSVAQLLPPRVNPSPEKSAEPAAKISGSRADK